MGDDYKDRFIPSLKPRKNVSDKEVRNKVKNVYLTGLVNFKIEMNIQKESGKYF